MNLLRFFASSPRRLSTVRRPRSIHLHVESLEQRRLLAIDTVGAVASPWQNAALPADVNADGQVTAQDAAMVINELNAHGTRSLTASVSRDAFLASSLRTSANTVESGSMFLDTNGDGMLTPQDVALIINQLNETAEPLVRVRLEVTDAAGNPVTQVNVGDNFQLRAYVLDLRTTGNTGVVSAYTDVTFNSTLASASGAVVHAADYTSIPTGTTTTPGVVDEAGGFANSISPLGPNERLLFTVPFTATAAGLINFAADAADLIGSEVLLYDMNPVVSPMQVIYGTTSLVVGPPEISIADVSLAEGSSGSTSFEFTVTLSHEYQGQVAVQYALQAGTATTSIDYLNTSGTLTFDPGQTTKTFTVTVLGDTLNEIDETFLVNLTNPTVGTLSRAQATGTIVNDDPVPTLSINTPAAQTENAGVTPLAFTVTLSAMSGQDVVVHYSTANGTATAGQDYVAQSNGTLTIPAGQLTGTIDVALLDDTADEPDETFTVTLSTPTGATLAAGQEVGTGTILDNDSTPTLSISNASVQEGNSGTTDLVFTVMLSAVSNQDVSVSFVTQDQTASDSSDYDAANGTLTILAGQTTGTITVKVRGDGAVEPNETFRVDLSDATNASIAVGSATGTITNDDSVVPTIAISSPAARAENDGPMAFTVTLSQISTQDVVVHYSTANGTATAGQDYTGQTNATVTIPAGQLTGVIDVTLLNDTADELDQTFTVTLLSSTTGATLATGQEVATGTILDNDDAPTVSIANASISEGNTGTKILEFTVTLSTISDKDVSVSFVTQDDTASDSSDYDAANGTLTIAAGQTSGKIMVTVRGDTAVEADETFRVDLSDPTNASIADGSATGTITNDDSAVPTIAINSPAARAENDGPMAFTVTLSQISTQDVVVHYSTANGTATAGQDFTGQTNATVTIPAGQLTGVINVALLNDTADELDQTFTVTLLSSTTGATLATGQEVATGTILDNDDEPSVSIASASTSEGNTGTKILEFTVSLSAISDKDVSVSFVTADLTATEGVDYEPANGTLTIAAGQSSGKIMVTVRGDATIEPDETFRVDLSDPTNASIAVGSATGTITNDDLLVPEISINSPAGVAENNAVTPIVFTVTLSQVSAQDVVVHYATANGTATAGQDYTAPTNGTLTIPAGQTTGTISVGLLDDTADEPDQTFTVTLSAPTNGTLKADKETGTGTILDNDATPTISIANSTVAEGNSGTTDMNFTVRLSAVSEQDVTVQYATANDTATASSDFVDKSGTLTILAGQLTGTITIVVNGDTTAESDEAFKVNLSTPVNATIATNGGTATGTIVEDEVRVVVSAQVGEVTENATTQQSLVYVVTVLGDPGIKDVTVHYATNPNGSSAIAGKDYTAVSGTLTFKPGERSKTVTVPVLDDLLDEVTENVQLSLSDATNATIPSNGAASTASILDNDATPTLSIADASVVEGANGTTQMVFTVTLSAASGQEVAVDFATANDIATAGLDFVGVAGSAAGDTALTFSPGQTTKTITVEVKGDATLEPDEAFTLTLSNPTAATLARATATGTIVDDDTPGFAGYVYNDLNHNGVKDPLETGIAGVVLTLTGTDSDNHPVNLTQTTGADGSYRFKGVLPGNYTVVESHPQDYQDGVETPGGSGITSSASDQFFALLGVGDQTQNNNFGENGLKPTAINKTLLFASRLR